LVHGALSRLNHMDENQQALHNELLQLRATLQQQNNQKRHQTLGTLTLASGVFAWWQAFTLGIPELVGPAIAVGGMIWLLLKA